jgi:hypothetical protein
MSLSDKVGSACQPCLLTDLGEGRAAATPSLRRGAGGYLSQRQAAILAS